MDDNEKEKIAAEIEKIKDGLVKAGINEKYIYDGPETKDMKIVVYERGEQKCLKMK